MTDSQSSERCRLCPPDKPSTHTTKDHVKILMQSVGTGPSSVPDRVQRQLRTVDPEDHWSAIIHPEHPPDSKAVWLALMSPSRGYFVVRLAADVTDSEIGTWANDFANPSNQRMDRSG